MHRIARRWPPGRAKRPTALSRANGWPWTVADGPRNAAGVERCDQCGFTYDENTATTAASAIRAGTAQLTAILKDGPAELRTRCEPARWSLRWLAIHTMHEVRHHLLDVRQQILGKTALTPAEREARWRLVVRFAIEAASEDEARAVLSRALAGLDPELRLRGEPVIRPRHRHIPDAIWIAEVPPDLTRLQAIDPDDAKTRCRYLQGHFPAGVYWSLPLNTGREAKAEWPADIWQRQPGRDDALLHPAVRGVMIFCAVADSASAGYT